MPTITVEYIATGPVGPQGPQGEPGPGPATDEQVETAVANQIGGAVAGQIQDAVDDYMDDHPSIATFSPDAKYALLALLEKVAYTDANGQTYLDTLEEELFKVKVESIEAVYTQSGTVYTGDTLDDLRSGLVVTATYADETTDTVTTYTLSGSLTVGTSTITVTYGGKTDTFTVTVTKGFLYTPAKGLLSEQSYVSSSNISSNFSESIYNDNYLRIYSPLSGSGSTAASSVNFSGYKFSTKATATLEFIVADQVYTNSSNTTTPGTIALCIANDEDISSVSFGMASTGFARYNGTTGAVRFRKNEGNASAWLDDTISLNTLHTLVLSIENGDVTVSLDGTTVVSEGNLFTGKDHITTTGIRIMNSNQNTVDFRIKSLEMVVE